MVLQRNVTPQVGHYEVLSRVKMKTPWHTRPLPAQYMPFTILHLIVIGERTDGMLARFDGCRLQGPAESVIGLHEQIRCAHRTINAFI